MKEIRLLLVDDHVIVRTGLKMLLGSFKDMTVIGEAGSAIEAFQKAQELSPDVVIMDITLPDDSAITVTRQLKEIYPHINIIALSIYEDEKYFFEMLQAGASGYLPKQATSEDLEQAIRSVSIGQVFIYPTLARALVADFLGRTRQGKQRESLDGLTPREYEVLELVVSDFSNEEISKHLGISKHTVARHRENLMQRLGLHNRAELVKYAIRKGLIKL